MLGFRSLLAPACVSLLTTALGGCFISDLDDFGEREEPVTEDPERPDDIDGPALVLRISADPNAPRLNNFGLPAPMIEGHAGQDPVMHRIGIHHAELAPNALTPLGVGLTILNSPHTSEGGEPAVDFDQEPIVAPGGEIVAAALADLVPGTYEYLRVAVSYQEYDVDLEVELAGQPMVVTGRVASFVEGNTFIRDLHLDGETVPIDGNRAQGFWAFKTPYTGITTGQAPVGATTVPNPIDSTSPIEVGSCIVTAAFDEPLVIRGDEDDDLVVSVTLSIDRSFEWIDSNGDGSWQPLAGELVVDMGVRGMTLAVE